MSRRPRATTFPNAVNGRPGLQDIAKLIQDRRAKDVIILAGAGISTSAGIPDFRSPETGLYANLQKYNLPYAEAIFSIDYFKQSPEAFFALAQEIYPGNHLPTLTHYFFTLLHQKELLRRVFSQNIDTLESIADLDPEMIVEAHGSFSSSKCLSCLEIYAADEIRDQIAKGEVVRCQRSTCKGKSVALIKPQIVFFGESLPARFFEKLPDFASCDLLIVIGTSLSVQPFASLIDRVDPSCPRLLINLECVSQARVPRPNISASSPSPSSDFGSDSDDSDGNSFADGIGGFDFDGRTKRIGGIRDVWSSKHSDDGIAELADLLGWTEELNEMMRKGHERLTRSEASTKEGEAIQVEPVSVVASTVDVPLDSQEMQDGVVEETEATEIEQQTSVDALAKGLEKAAL